MMTNYGTKLSKEIFGTEEVYQPEAKNVQVNTFLLWPLTLTFTGMIGNPWTWLR